MNELATVWILLGMCCLIMGFVELRNHAETARKQAEKYCEQVNLQYVSIYRDWFKLKWGERGPEVHFCYIVEVSSNGENQFDGKLLMRNRKVSNIEFPPYPM